MCGKDGLIESPVFYSQRIGCLRLSLSEREREKKPKRRPENAEKVQGSPGTLGEMEGAKY